MKYFIAIGVIVIVILLGCNTDKSAQKKNEALVAKGKTITSETFIALSSELMKAMGDGGVAEAVKYCNVEALPITKRLADKYGVEIKRTSDKLRNPKNKASAEDLKVIDSYKKKLRSGSQLKPQVIAQGKASNFYAPILVNDLCLKCHGNKSDIDTYDIITDLYPNDLATGYKAGDLRGIWSVKFLK